MSEKHASVRDAKEKHGDESENQHLLPLPLLLQQQQHVEKLQKKREKITDDGCSSANITHLSVSPSVYLSLCGTSSIDSVADTNKGCVQKINKCLFLYL